MIAINKKKKKLASCVGSYIYSARQVEQGFKALVIKIFLKTLKKISIVISVSSQFF